MGKNMELDAPHVTFILSAMQKITRKKEGLGPKNIAVSFCIQGDSVILIDFSWI